MFSKLPLSILFPLLATTIKADIFTLTASLPGNALDGLPVNAAGQAFYLGGSPASYCPTSVGSACPNVTATVLAAGGSALFVEVPGGQQVYVQSSGALGFTQAHSSYVPAGATVGGFENKTVEDTGGEVTVLTAAGGILACPKIPIGTNTTSYQVFAKTAAFNETSCTTLDGLLPAYLPSGSPPGAWQYI